MYDDAGRDNSGVPTRVGFTQSLKPFNKWSQSAVIPASSAPCEADTTNKTTPSLAAHVKSNHNTTPYMDPKVVDTKISSQSFRKNLPVLSHLERTAKNTDAKQTMTVTWVYSSLAVQPSVSTASAPPIPFV
jgi:hypothetical protein